MQEIQHLSNLSCRKYKLQKDRTEEIMQRRNLRTEENDFQTEKDFKVPRTMTGGLGEAKAKIN